jgi:hypothetical protein
VTRPSGIMKPCEVCGVIMKVLPWQVSRGAGRFCGMVCRGTYASKNYRGANSFNWKGGQYTCADGYVHIRTENHPRAVNNYVKRAVLVLESKLGRYLTVDEISHHINEVKDDDRPENLEPMTRLKHNQHHGSKRLGLCSKVTTVCLYCGEPIFDYPSAKRRFCGWSCSVKFNKPRLGTGKNART